MKVRFLLDENLSPRIRVAVLRHFPNIDILRVGDTDAPPLHTLDPDILYYLEQSQRLLITRNRASMPGHVAAHLAPYFCMFSCKNNAFLFITDYILHEN